MHVRSWTIAGALAAILVSGSAQAEEGAVCKDAYEQSQLLMKANPTQSTLLPAREMLRTCMRSNCKDWVVADCSKWLGEVETRIPTVVFSARDTAGRDLTEIAVTTPSGGSIASRLDGRAVEMEPGEQVFVFVAPDGTRREKRVLVREGEKTQSVTTVFDGPPDANVPRPSGLSTESEKAQRSEPGTLRYVGYGIAAAGVIGIGLGAVFGLRAISKKDSANCIANECDGPPLDDANSAATISTIGFVAGGALLAGGIALVVFGPKSAPVHARVSAGNGSTGLQIGGRF